MSFAAAITEDKVIGTLVRDTKDNMPCNNKSRGTKRTYSEEDFVIKKRKKTHKWFKKIRRRRSGDRRAKTRKPIRTKPEAPFNSTQFIMDEHDKLNDSDLSSNSRPRRNRDSSISVDSEDYDFYTSEEDEFLRRDFWTTYEDAHAEILDALPHSQLVQEYLSMEDKVSLLEQELVLARAHDRLRIREPSPGGDEDEVLPGEVPVDAETAAKIEVFRSEIKKLESENLRLKRDTVTSAKPCHRCNANYSSSSELTHSSVSSDSETEIRSGAYCQNPSDLPDPKPNRTPTGEEIELVTTTDSVQKKITDHNSDSGVASFEGGSSGDDARTEKSVVAV